MQRPNEPFKLIVASTISKQKVTDSMQKRQNCWQGKLEVSQTYTRILVRAAVAVVRRLLPDLVMFKESRMTPQLSAPKTLLLLPEAPTYRILVLKLSPTLPMQPPLHLLADLKFKEWSERLVTRLNATVEVEVEVEVAVHRLLLQLLHLLVVVQLRPLRLHQRLLQPPRQRLRLARLLLRAGLHLLLQLVALHLRPAQAPYTLCTVITRTLQHHMLFHLLQLAAPRHLQLVVDHLGQLLHLPALHLRVAVPHQLQRLRPLAVDLRLPRLQPLHQVPHQLAIFRLQVVAGEVVAVRPRTKAPKVRSLAQVTLVANHHLVNSVARVVTLAVALADALAIHQRHLLVATRVVAILPLAAMITITKAGTQALAKDPCFKTGMSLQYGNI